MTNIIFQYTPYETNWLNPVWRKAKMAENRKRDIMFVENKFPDYTNDRKARLVGMEYAVYMYWKKNLIYRR